MLVPYYWNKKSTDKMYDNNDYKWVDLDRFLNILSKEVLEDFKDFDWFNIVHTVGTEKFEQKCKKHAPVNIDWDNFIDFKDFIVSAKLLFMTWFTCKYGLWKKWWLNEIKKWKVYTHHGIDLILPKWTPIVSFSSWDVVSAQYANGYGNYIVIKSKIDWDTLYFCYEHLESIKVSKWEEIKKWDIIWTCWNTWNAYWYHLHFQIDKNTWSFHPYWSSWENDIEKTLKNCIDPWLFLRWDIESIKDKISNKVKYDISKDKNWNWDNQNKEDSLDIIWDLTKEIDEKEKINTKLVSDKDEKDTWKKIDNFNENIEIIAPKKDGSTKDKSDLINNIEQKLANKSLDTSYIKFFINLGILKWDNWNYFLEHSLTRYQITLILYRLYKTWLLNIKEHKTSCNIKFKDITGKLKSEKEFMEALDFVVCNDIITWDYEKFLPWNKLTWEQFLAIIWRVFAGLKNTSWEQWFENYYNWAVNKKLIWSSWTFIWHFITRNEVLKILHTLILS